MRPRKLRLGTCRECSRMLVAAVSCDDVAPYSDQCTGCGSILDGESVTGAAVAVDD